ncbi:MAG: hypothetical protein ACE5G2_06710 [Candidatus Krumholzibacteriia bacterium]
MNPPAQRVLTVEQLLAWSQNRPHPVRLWTSRDALPGGLAATMVPVLLDWKASDLSENGGHYIVRTLNHGGNPIAGTTVLCPARIPAHGVKKAEFVMVPLGFPVKPSLASHAMLRLIFDEEEPVEVRSGAGVETGGDATVPDLIFSWEAWRPPGVAFNMLKGLDPTTFDLTLRIYSGAQRFLEDALSKRDWYSYPLKLPGGRAGLTELLRVGLALGDGVARRSLDRLLSEAERHWLGHAPPAATVGERHLGQWEKLREALVANHVPEDPLVSRQHETSYQTLQRSCITMALHTIDVTVERLRARGLVDSRHKKPRLKLGPKKLAPWMEELAHADLLGIFLRAPFALWWMVRHQDMLPHKAPHRLEEAGLLERRGGQVVMRHYSLDGQTPYGQLKDHLIA